MPQEVNTKPSPNDMEGRERNHPSFVGCGLDVLVYLIKLKPGGVLEVGKMWTLNDARRCCGREKIIKTKTQQGCDQEQAIILTNQRSTSKDDKEQGQIGHLIRE